MNVLKKIGIVLTFITLTLVSYIGYLGGFKTIIIDEVEFPSTEIVVYLHKGSYRTIGDSWMKFEAAYREAGGEECTGLALYFDPPGTPEDQLRSVLGCDLSKIPLGKQAQVKSKFPSILIPTSKSVHATFPFKNRLSYMMAPVKVYTAMDTYLTKNGIVPDLAIESYGVNNQSELIEFFMPKDLKHSSFESILRLFK